jgi:hypothetical protein
MQGRENQITSDPSHSYNQKGIEQKLQEEAVALKSLPASSVLFGCSGIEIIR